MNNRISSSPILFLIIFSLVVGPSLLSQAEPGVPSANVATSTNDAPASAATNQPAAMAAEPTPVPATTAPMERPSTYTVVKGDSLWLIAHKNGCSVKGLKKLNNLTKNNLKPGQVLKLPPAHSSGKTAAPTPTVRPNASVHQPKALIHHKTYAQAQPVQDFDIPASTFASCPVPIPSEPDADAPSPTSPAPDDTEAHALRAELVSPSEFNPAPAPKVETPDVASTPSPSTSPARATVVAESTPAYVAPAPKPRGFFASLFAPISNDWGNRFLREARALGDEGIEYDEDWRPPGEDHSWTMDCSNTTRYLYKVITGIELPRTASDQYYYLHLQNKAWDVPQASNGFADCDFLRENLKAGDLLFWENTYRPERQPPITHVMVFLGTNEKGQWIMAGSQTSRGGEHNRPNGGPDIYVFDPTKPCGGYSTWLGLVHHQGRFCAFGRPLEADASKLSVAENN